jgi:ankyrin repeat protein
MQSHKKLESDLYYAACSGNLERTKRAIAAIKESIQNIADLKKDQPKFAKHWKIPNINALGDNLAFSSIAKKHHGPALHVAVSSGFHEIVKLLIEEKANVHMKGSESILDNQLERQNHLSPLEIATIKNYPAIIKSLVEAKANINERNYLGLTLLMRAAKDGSYGALKVLMEEKADINRKDVYGFTALMYAAQKGETYIVNLLIENKADVKAKSLTRTTASELASAENHLECMNTLIKAEKKQIEETPIHPSSSFSSRFFHASLSKSLLSPSVRETQASYSEKKGNRF